MRPRQPIDPAPVRLRPGTPRVVQPATKQELAQAVPAPLSVHARVIAGSAQIANCFFGRRRRPYHRQQSGAVQFRQLPRVSPVGLDPITRFARHQRRRDHVAADPAPLELPLQRISARPCFVTARDRTGCNLFEPPPQAVHQSRLVPHPPHRGLGRVRRQHCNLQLRLVCIDSYVGDRLAHDRLLSSAALTPLGVNPRIVGGLGHLVTCSRTTTARLRAGHSISSSGDPVAPRRACRTAPCAACSSLTYSRICSLLAPCQPGA